MTAQWHLHFTFHHVTAEFMLSHNVLVTQTHSSITGLNGGYKWSVQVDCLSNPHSLTPLNGGAGRRRAHSPENIPTSIQAFLVNHTFI